MLDGLVVHVAFFLITANISLERQQQLYLKHLRRTLLPPISKSKIAFSIKVVEVLLAVALPLTSLTMILLVFGGNLAATNILLNGVAISFVLLIDDTLPEVFISASDKNAIDEFCAEAGRSDALQTIKRQGLAHAIVVFCVFQVQFALACNASCNGLYMKGIFLAFCTRCKIAEPTFASSTRMRPWSADNRLASKKRS